MARRIASLNSLRAQVTERFLQFVLWLNIPFKSLCAIANFTLKTTHMCAHRVYAQCSAHCVEILHNPMYSECHAFKSTACFQVILFSQSVHYLYEPSSSFELPFELKANCRRTRGLCLGFAREQFGRSPRSSRSLDKRFNWFVLIAFYLNLSELIRASEFFGS